jgi:hypothetical protein
MSYNVANQSGQAAGPYGAIQYSDGGGNFLGTSSLTINNINNNLGGGTGYFGSFFDNTNPQAASIDTPTQVILGNVQTASGMTLSNNTITFQKAGTYGVTATAITGQSSGSGAIIYTWWKQNGSNVNNSTTQIRLGNASDHTMLINSICITVAVGDTLQLWWQTNGNGQLLLPSTGFVPNSPPVTVNVSQVSYVGPGTVTPLTSSAGTLTANFNGFSTGLFSNTLTQNITALSLSNGIAGGQYQFFLYAQGSGSVYTVSNSLGAGIKTNLASPLSVPLNSVCKISVDYSGSVYLCTVNDYV